MASSIIVGTQWGDEGKGKVIDIMAAKAAAHILEYRDVTVIVGKLGVTLAALFVVWIDNILL